MAMFAAQMVKDGVIKVGWAELGRATLTVLPSEDSSIGKNNFVNAFFRL